MPIAFLIMLREGMEAAIVVGIIASYLAQTGRRRWLPGVWAGVALAVGVTVGIGAVLQGLHAEFPQAQQELFEGLVGLVAVAMLTAMIFWMRKAGRALAGTLHRSIDAALTPGRRAGWALLATVFLAVAREGLETVFFLFTVFQQDESGEFALGALLGLAAAIAVGLAIYVGGVRLNLKRFFQGTGLLLIFVAAGVLAGALRALHEAGIWNGLQGIVWDLSAVLPEQGFPGALLSGLFGYREAPSEGEVLVYLAYLLPALALYTAARPPARPAPVSA